MKERDEEVPLEEPVVMGVVEASLAGCLPPPSEKPFPKLDKEEERVYVWDNGGGE